MNDIKLLVADIDGTLIPDEPHTLTPYCHSVLKRLQDKGVLIGIASGRDCNQIKVQGEEWNFDFDMYIGLNGFELYDNSTKQITTCSKLKKESKKEIITTMMAKFPWLNPATYQDNKRYSLREDTVKYGNHNVKMDAELVKDISDFWQLDGGKLMFRIDEDKMDEVFSFAKTIVKEDSDYYVTLTQTTMMEFNQKDAMKSKALIRYCQAHNIDLKEVITFGDMINDNDMLEVAGQGVALKNASESTKKIADKITELDNNHDGLAKFIENYYL